MNLYYYLYYYIYNEESDLVEMCLIGSHWLLVAFKELHKYSLKNNVNLLNLSWRLCNKKTNAVSCSD